MAVQGDTHIRWIQFSYIPYFSSRRPIPWPMSGALMGPCCLTCPARGAAGPCRSVLRVYHSRMEVQGE